MTSTPNSVTVSETQNTVTVSGDGTTVIVSGDGGTVTIRTGDASQVAFDALVARIEQLESVNYLVLQDGN